MRIDKFEKDRDRDDDADARMEAEAERALLAVDNYRYAAMRQYHYPTWPASGEIRNELDRLKRMPDFERAELLKRAGFGYK